MEFIPKLWILTGCTAIGKTNLSLSLARFLNAEILSCDSVQVYRGADIGSAKIRPEEMQNIPHHGLDLCDPSESFDAGQYVQYARSIVDQVRQRGKHLLIVGGSGFYLKTFFESIIDSIIVPQNICRDVELQYGRFGLDGLQSAVKSYGSVDLNTSDWNNPRRLMAILKKQRITGLAQASLKQEFAKKVCPFEGFTRRVILLERHPELLQKRIEQRIEAMFQMGFIEEVKHLGNMCLPLANTIGYREVKAYLGCGVTNHMEISEEQLKKSIIMATCQLVKKQKTWFRKQIPIHYRINLDEYSFNESFDFIVSFCKNKGI